MHVKALGSWVCNQGSLVAQAAHDFLHANRFTRQEHD